MPKADVAGVGQEISMSIPNIEAPLVSIGHNPNIITQAVLLAYTGWGYNFYSTTNKLRADDLLIRSKISGLLNRVAADLSGFGAKLAATVPAPSRQVPLPDRDIMAIVVELRRLSSEIDSLSVKITALTTPGRDKIWDRHRDQNTILLRLQGFDLYLGQLVFDLKGLVETKMPTEMKDEQVREELDVKLNEIRSALREREDMLAIDPTSS
jgi:hypothetical protein